jgi:FkbM family methyltransferase
VIALHARFDEITEAGSGPALRARLAKRWPALTRERLKAVAIVGAADEGLRLVGICAGLGIEVAAVADDHPAKRGTTVDGRKVEPVESLERLDRSIPVVIASHRALKLRRRLAAMGFATVAPFMTLQLLDPQRFPPHMFHERLLEDLVESLPRLRRLGESLGDDRSREVLAAVIGYRLSGEPADLEPIIDWELYGAGELLEYGPNEVYVDGGSFDGDSIRLFIERVGGRYERIIGFEPDPKTFARLKANFASEPRVRPYNAGLHRAGAVLRFDDAGTRGSILVESGGITVPVVSLDEIMQGHRTTYVKMNIEGAELDALQGAAQTLRRWKPKLAISSYHRADHLWRVAETIREIEPRYSVFLRQHDGGIIETVTYAKA